MSVVLLSGMLDIKVKKGKGRYSSSWELHLRATGCHLRYGMTQFYLPPVTSECTPAMQAGTRFTYPGGMEGWVDLVDLIAPRPGVEPATFRSRVWRQTAASPRWVWSSFGLMLTLAWSLLSVFSKEGNVISWTKYLICARITIYCLGF